MIKVEMVSYKIDYQYSLPLFKNQSIFGFCMYKYLTGNKFLNLKETNQEILQYNFLTLNLLLQIDWVDNDVKW